MSRVFPKSICLLLFSPHQLVYRYDDLGPPVRAGGPEGDVQGEVPDDQGRAGGRAALRRGRQGSGSSSKSSSLLWQIAGFCLFVSNRQMVFCLHLVILPNKRLDRNNNVEVWKMRTLPLTFLAIWLIPSSCPAVTAQSGPATKQILQYWREKRYIK